MRLLMVVVVMVVGLGAALGAEKSTLLGKSRDDIEKQFGPPVSRIVSGKREVMIYPKGRAVLEDGIVVDSEEPISRVSVASVPNTPPIVRASQSSAPAPTAKAAPAAKEPPSKSLMSGGLSKILAVVAVVAIAGAVVAMVMLKPKGTVKAGLTMPPMEMARPAAGTRRRVLTEKDLFDLEWRRYEELVEGYFKAGGFLSRRVSVGPDAGVDLYLYREDSGKPVAYVQCNSFFSRKVDLKLVKEFFGVMAADKVAEGYFVTTADFTEEARAWAEGKKLHLIEGAGFLGKFNALADEKRQEVIDHVFRGDYTTPTCPKCDIKMVLREAEKPFWGCKRFPKCYAKLEVRGS